MQVILLERIGRLGQMGDIVKVRPGFARNFLLPQNKALRATKENMSRFENERSQLEATNLERKQEAEAVAKKLNGLSFVVLRQAGELGPALRLGFDPRYSGTRSPPAGSPSTACRFSWTARSRTSACTMCASACIRKSRSRSRSTSHALRKRRSVRPPVRTWLRRHATITPPSRPLLRHRLRLPPKPSSRANWSILPARTARVRWDADNTLASIGFSAFNRFRLEAGRSSGSQVYARQSILAHSVASAAVFAWQPPKPPAASAHSLNHVPSELSLCNCEWPLQARLTRSIS